jgi:SOS-response transcriptional repressor LexA
MAPEFVEGDVIIVDPERVPTSGSYVVVKNGAEATFKQYIRDGESHFLKPLNDRYPIKEISGPGFKIVGVVVEKRKKY